MAYGCEKHHLAIGAWVWCGEGGQVKCPCGGHSWYELKDGKRCPNCYKEIPGYILTMVKMEKLHKAIK